MKPHITIFIVISDPYLMSMSMSVEVGVAFVTLKTLILVLYELLSITYYNQVNSDFVLEYHFFCKIHYIKNR